MNLHDLLNNLEAEEQKFLQVPVLAPVLSGRGVHVRIAGIICNLKVDDTGFRGWAVLQPTAIDRAVIVRAASLTERCKYLQLLPEIQLFAVARSGQVWWALPAQRGDGRFKIEGAVRLELVEVGVQPFDAVVARFDGERFWYERRDMRRNPALAAYLRQAFGEGVEPKALKKKGLSREEHHAYEWAWQSLEEARRNRHETRLAKALAHADGKLVSFVERKDIYTVTYQVNGHSQTSNIRKDDLSVVTSGICLSGRDNDFDLTSLVGVMREAVLGGHD
jgi:hypothetical protein